MKNLSKLRSIVILVIVAVFSSCTSVFDEDKLVGDPWYLSKIVYYDSDDEEVEYEYPSEDVKLKFYYDGGLSILSVGVDHFGYIYEDWVDGSWDFEGDYLYVTTPHGDFEYRLEQLTSWKMILSYYQDYEDYPGVWNTYRVEEIYSRE